MRSLLKRADEYSMCFGIWVAKVVPWVLKPLKFWWADRMILACAYQDRKGDIVIIYRPACNTSNHELCLCKRYPFLKRALIPEKLAHQPLLGGKMFFVRCKEERRSYYGIRAKNPFRTVFSRIIERRANKTVFQKSSFGVITKPPIRFFWKNPSDRDFWFSFLTIEDKEGNLISAIYTNEESWRFNDIKTLPYYVHDPAKAFLLPGKLYKAILYVVDRFNWVTHIDTLTFSL